MATPKRITDLTAYTSVLPYSSELFGVYQPLLGWKSKRIKQRFESAFKKDRYLIINKLQAEFAGLVDINYKDGNQVEISIKPGVIDAGKIRTFNSIVQQQVAAKLPAYQEYKSTVWASVITTDFIESILKNTVTPEYKKSYPDFIKTAGTSVGTEMLRAKAAVSGNVQRIQNGAFEHQLQYESSVAGTLLFLVKAKKFDTLADMFYSTKNNLEKVNQLAKLLSAKDGAEAFLDISNLNPRDKEDIAGAALSPISVVHLFRQYFFELDTFLGTPVNHVWLSPGSSVELIESHTRRTTVERTLETTLDILTKSEKSTTNEEEISDAVKQDNQQDIKFGASVTASYASIDATSSFDYSNSQKSARETTHKRMRQQTEKLSSEIRKNFKSTFKTVSEFTDISSTKHVMANSTNELINYELRRKMRQVGVQVQDIGTFLCWQTYVDNPGNDLGLAKLIHIAKSPDLESLPHPEEIPLLQPFQEQKRITIPFISIEGTDADNEGEVYKDGVEVDNSEWFGSLEKIQSDFVQEFICPKAEHELTNIEFDSQGQPVTISRKGAISNNNGKASFMLHLNSADFQGKNNLEVGLILHWSPVSTANDAIKQKNEANLTNFKAEEKAAYEKAYIETVKERVNIASRITTRKSEELREEERIVVYRKLIQDMLLNGVSLPDDKTRHVVSELLNAIFDIDKMLYFVAPEWWRPRQHRGKQQLQETPPPAHTDVSGMVTSGTNFAMQKGLIKHMYEVTQNIKPGVMAANTTGWGGINDSNRGNYYITDESEPAKLGSSLGWLLQLDGDNMRNAFLNAPWVKAVIPIRPGKEEAAINWLKGVEGMNGITDDAIYRTTNQNEKDINGNPLNGQKMIDVLMDLAKKIKKKYEEGIETGTYPKQDEIAEPALVDEGNTVTATPIDRVYEHGFFPLNGSFRANVGKNYEIFDQWIEILPTDQIVPVEVKYDSKTGRQI
jgi:hypothetical protein